MIFHTMTYGECHINFFTAGVRLFKKDDDLPFVFNDSSHNYLWWMSHYFLQWRWILSCLFFLWSFKIISPFLPFCSSIFLHYSFIRFFFLCQFWNLEKSFKLGLWGIGWKAWSIKVNLDCRYWLIQMIISAMILYLRFK